MIESLHRAIRDRLLDPRTGMIYTFLNPRAGAPVFPTVEEVWRSIPNTAGWQTPIEDCCLCGGTALASALLRAEAEPGPEADAEVRLLFAGLRTLAACGRRRGFVARGVLPDGRTHYMDTSADQVTHFLYGIWRYWTSALPAEAERAFLRACLADIALQLEEDAFYIQTDAGSGATFGDLDALRFTRVERVLQVFAVAWAVTGEARFLDTYRLLKAERNGERMRILRDEEPPLSDCLYALLQTQLALRVLVEIEPDPVDRAVFAAAMVRVARGVEPRAEGFRAFHAFRLDDDWEYDWRRNWSERRTDNIWAFSRALFASERYRPIRHVTATVREPAEALLCMRLSGEPALDDRARRLAAEMLRTVDPGPVWISDPWVHFEYAARLAEAAP